MNEQKMKYPICVFTFSIITIVYLLVCLGGSKLFFLWISGVLVPVICSNLIYYKKIQFIPIFLGVHAIADGFNAYELFKMITYSDYEHKLEIIFVFYAISYIFVIAGDIMMIILIISCKKGSINLSKLWCFPGLSVFLGTGCILVWEIINNNLLINFEIIGQLLLGISYFSLGLYVINSIEE